MTTTDMVDPVYLAGVFELAQAFKVSSATVSSANRWPGIAGFPKPIVVLASGPVYDIRDVIAWWDDWVPARGGTKTGMRPELVTS
jgi:hypothetical protein